MTKDGNKKAEEAAKEIRQKEQDQKAKRDALERASEIYEGKKRK